MYIFFHEKTDVYVDVFHLGDPEIYFSELSGLQMNTEWDSIPDSLGNIREIK